MLILLWVLSLGSYNLMPFPTLPVYDSSDHESISKRSNSPVVREETGEKCLQDPNVNLMSIPPSHFCSGRLAPYTQSSLPLSINWLMKRRNRRIKSFVLNQNNAPYGLWIFHVKCSVNLARLK